MQLSWSDTLRYTASLSYPLPLLTFGILTVIGDTRPLPFTSQVGYLKTVEQAKVRKNVLINSLSSRCARYSHDAVQQHLDQNIISLTTPRPSRTNHSTARYQHTTFASTLSTTPFVQHHTELCCPTCTQHQLLSVVPLMHYQPRAPQFRPCPSAAWASPACPLYYLCLLQFNHFPQMAAIPPSHPRSSQRASQSLRRLQLIADMVASDPDDLSTILTICPLSPRY
jgi:hypothetical protein